MNFFRTIRFVTLVSVATFMVSACTTKDALPERVSATSFDSLPVLRTVSAFEGIDQNGKPLTSSALKGHIWLASFFFSRCETICPALNTVQTTLQRDFANRIQFVSISSDPEFDTPAVMKLYGEQFGAKDGVWWFVNMPHEKMLDVAANGLGLIPPGSPEMHSTRFVLVDTAMNVRGYYDSADSSDVAKLRTVLSELK
ncbi:MAG TPA: SCO family protein [Candidatus Didemnitutus sp.]|nr:SCO family protein [Candidatus Didemnitutus sp.]